MLRKLGLLVLGLIVPPAGVWLARGRGVATLSVLGLFGVAQALFWLVAAGPGVVLWMISILAGLVLILVASGHGTPILRGRS